MSILGTLEGIGAGDPIGSFMKSNQAAIDQAGNAAAGKALIQLFNPQVPGAQPMSGPPPTGMPPGGPQPSAQAGPPQSAVPGAQQMPPTPTMPGSPQGPQGAGPPPGPSNPPPGAASAYPNSFSQGQPNPQLVQAMQQRALLQAQLQRMQQQRGGGGMPQAPQPGPGGQIGAPQGPMSPQGQQPQIPPQFQAVARGVQQNQGQLTWQTLVQGVVKANPGASPEVIASAVTKLLPLMNADSLQQWRQIQAQLGAGRLQETVTHHGVQEGEAEDRLRALEDWRQAQGGRADKRIEQTDVRQTETERSHRAHETLATTREGRLDRQGQARIDQRYQQLDNERQRLEQAVKKAQTTKSYQDWRAALDAQRQHMRTAIAADQMNDAKAKKKLLDENEAWYNQQIREMRKDEPGSFSNKFTPAETMTPAQPAQ